MRVEEKLKDEKKWYQFRFLAFASSEGTFWAGCDRCLILDVEQKMF